MTDPVVFTDVETDNGMMIGHAELNMESTLNSLSLEMVRLLHPAIDAWAERDDIVCIVIAAAGDRAFCAGGDIQALYAAINANHAADEVVNDYPFRFFEEEYRLDFALHECSKPVITIGHGIVMGGGLGIFGASQYLPQVLNLHNHGFVDFDKGCYLGQEIVARAQFRGQVKKTIKTFSWTTSMPSVGDTIDAGTVIAAASTETSNAGVGLAVA